MINRVEPHFSVSKMDGNGVEIETTQPVDHWAFLDEIEAPMWADLSCEANLTNQEIDDEWFHISHRFHQYSSHQLTSKVFHLDEEGPPSPKLPPSVSRSRGKNYKGKELGQSKCKVASSQQHLVKNLNSKSSWANSRPSKEVKIISQTEKLEKEIECPKASSVCESGLNNISGPNSSNEIISFGDSKPGHSSGLLTALRISLRKSCGTRQPSRVKVNGGRKSEGCKSSSSKSSVGSSSSGNHLILGETQKKDKMPESRNGLRISQPSRNKLKVPTVSKTPAVQVLRDVSSNPRRGNETHTSIAKAQQHSLRSKVLVEHKFNGPDQLAGRKAEKMGVAQHFNFSVDNSKTASGKMAVIQKSKSSNKAAVCMGHVQKDLKQGVLQRSDGRKLVGLKEQIGGRSKGKESTSVVQFR